MQKLRKINLDLKSERVAFSQCDILNFVWKYSCPLSTSKNIINVRIIAINTKQTNKQTNIRSVKSSRRAKIMFLICIMRNAGSWSFTRQRGFMSVYLSLCCFVWTILLKIKPSFNGISIQHQWSTTLVQGSEIALKNFAHQHLRIACKGCVTMACSSKDKQEEASRNNREDDC